MKKVDAVYVRIHNGVCGHLSRAPGRAKQSAATNARWSRRERSTFKYLSHGYPLFKHFSAIGTCALFSRARRIAPCNIKRDVHVCRPGTTLLDPYRSRASVVASRPPARRERSSNWDPGGELYPREILNYRTETRGQRWARKVSSRPGKNIATIIHLRCELAWQL